MLSKVGLVLGAAGMLAMAGCSSTSEATSPANDSSAVGSESPDSDQAISEVQLSERIDHVHGLVATSAGTVVAGTHSGARQVNRTGDVTTPGEQRDDLMGMTGTPGTLQLASSGHPGADSEFPNPVGLITSEDGGATWSPVSLQGRVDFHALAVNDASVIGYGGGPGLMVSADGGKTWDDGAQVQAVALAYSGDRVLATTTAGLQVSSDGGSTFSVLTGAPELVLVSAGTDQTVLGLDTSSWIWRSLDGGDTWEQVGPAPGAQAVAAWADGDGYAISETTLFVIS